VSQEYDKKYYPLALIPIGTTFNQIKLSIKTYKMYKTKMQSLILLIITSIKPSLSSTPTNTPIKDYTEIRAGIYSTSNISFIGDCVSGKHILAFERECASQIPLRVDAVIMAIFQVCALVLSLTSNF
jgi:hypothetical protein